MSGERFFAYATWPNLPDWLRCGWMVSVPNGVMHHHEFGPMVEWRCACKMVSPLAR